MGKRRLLIIFGSFLFHNLRINRYCEIVWNPPKKIFLECFNVARHHVFAFCVPKSFSGFYRRLWYTLMQLTTRTGHLPLANTVLSRKTLTKSFPSLRSTTISFIVWCTLIRELTASLNVQTDFIRAKLFARHCKLFLC